MSNSEIPHTENPYDPFDEGWRESQLCDPIVEGIELDMFELEAEYVERGDEMTDDEIEGRVRALHQRWPHTGDEARVSGPIAVRTSDRVVIAKLAERWGEPQDTSPFPLFHVKDEELISGGISGFSVEQPDGSYGFQMFYTYLDRASDAMLVCRPVESTAAYESLSLGAIDKYLHEQEPDAMETIEQALASTTRNPTLKLHRLREALSDIDASKWPDAKVEWLRRYTEALLDFDTEWQYLVCVEGETVVHEPNFTHRVRWDAPYEFWAKYREMWLEKDEDDHGLLARIRFEKPHQSNIIVPLGSLTRVQSSVPQLTTGEEIRAGRDVETPGRARKTTAHATIIEDERTPPRHEILAERQRILELIQVQVVEAKRTTYETKEEATAACQALTADIIRQLSEHNLMGAMLEVNGSEVFGMDSQPMSSWSTTEKMMLTMGTQVCFIDANNFFMKINPEYVVRGTLVDVVPTYNPCYKDGEEAYIVNPQLIIEDPATETYTIPGIQPALVELRLTRKISAGFTSANTIALEEYRQRGRRNQALREFRRTHGGHPATPILKRLHEALHHLDDDLYLEMEKPKLVSTLGMLIEQEPDETIATDIITAVKALFADRDEMLVQGDALLENNQILMSHVKGAFRGVVSVAAPDGERQRVAWVELEDTLNQLRHVRLATVQSLSL